MQPTPRRPERPVLWIIAGPNGSGKSSFYNRTDFEGWGGSVWIINPDLLTLTISESEGISAREANLAAVVRIERWLDTSIAVYQTIGVETVLSTGKYRRLLKKAQAHGFDVRLIYFLLDSAERQIERIGRRVRDGGHDVPEAAVRSRRLRSFRQLAWFCRKADRTYVFDNSSGEPDLLVQITPEGRSVRPERLPPDLTAQLARLRVTLA